MSAEIRDTASASADPVVDAFKPGIDTTLLDRNLRLTPTQRLEQLQAFVAFLFEARRAGAAGRPKDLEAVAELELLRDREP
jgi:hypothetical protein